MILTERTELGNQRPTVSRDQLIIKFVPYNDRRKVSSSKKLLKDSGVSIMESLTAFSMKNLTNTRETFGFSIEL